MGRAQRDLRSLGGDELDTFEGRAKSAKNSELVSYYITGGCDNM